MSTHSDTRELLALATWIYPFRNDAGTASDLPFSDVQGVSKENAHIVALATNRDNHGERVANYFSYDDGTQVAVFASVRDNRVYVVFRGTEADEAKKDWGTDLSVGFKNLDKNVSVHSGFWKCISSHREDIFGAVDRLLSTTKFNKDVKIFIVGHSLGGALSTIFGYCFAKSRPACTVCVVNFGAPAAGNAGFRDTCNSYSNLTMERIVNNADGVVASPPYPYVHVGATIRHLTDDGLKPYTSYRTWWMSFWTMVEDHSLVNYWARLETCPW